MVPARGRGEDALRSEDGNRGEGAAGSSGRPGEGHDRSKAGGCVTRAGLEEMLIQPPGVPGPG